MVLSLIACLMDWFEEGDGGRSDGIAGGGKGIEIAGGFLAVDLPMLT